jgi:hypothetical protein
MPYGWPWMPQSKSMAYHALTIDALWVAMDTPEYLYGVPRATHLCPVGGHGRLKSNPMACNALSIYALWVAMNALILSLCSAVRQPATPG